MLQKVDTHTIYAADLGRRPEPIRLIETHRNWTRAGSGRLIPSTRERHSYESPSHGTVAYLALHLRGTTVKSPRPTDSLAAAEWAPLGADSAAAASEAEEMNAHFAAQGLELTLVHRSRQLLATWEKFLSTLAPAPRS